MVSIIIRTKNEERWIASCLNSVFSQSFKDFEVVLVDNESEDMTIEKAKQFGVKKIVSCSDFLPGKALNMGIRESRGEYIVCLSGHCIPVNEQWLSNLLKNFDDPDVAGVYGRQEPMAFTPDSDKRDLTLVFGLDKKTQTKDSFFHNANSMIRRAVWEKIPFDEKVTNIEDRVWAKRVLEEKMKIVYEPESSVYHYHGIHQNGNKERCANVVRIMESLHAGHNRKSINAEKLNIVALICVRGAVQYLNGEPLMAHTIRQAKESKYIKSVIVSTDNKELAGAAEKFGAKAPFLREASLSKEYVDLASVLQYSLNRLEEARIYPDLVVSLEITFPFRPKYFLDDMISRLVEGGFDSVIAAKRENRAIWKEENGKMHQLEEGLMPRQFKDPVYIELKGLGCVTHPAFLRQGSLIGNKIGIYELDDPYSHLEARSAEDLKMASILMKEWKK